VTMHAGPVKFHSLGEVSIKNEREFLTEVNFFFVGRSRGGGFVRVPSLFPAATKRKAKNVSEDEVGSVLDGEESGKLNPDQDGHEEDDQSDAASSSSKRPTKKHRGKRHEAGSESQSAQDPVDSEIPMEDVAQSLAGGPNLVVQKSQGTSVQQQRNPEAAAMSTDQSNPVSPMADTTSGQSPKKFLPNKKIAPIRGHLSDILGAAGMVTASDSSKEAISESLEKIHSRPFDPQIVPPQWPTEFLPPDAVPAGSLKVIQGRVKSMSGNYLQCLSRCLRTALPFKNQTKSARLKALHSVLKRTLESIDDPATLERYNLPRANLNWADSSCSPPLPEIVASAKEAWLKSREFTEFRNMSLLPLYLVAHATGDRISFMLYDSRDEEMLTHNGGGVPSTRLISTCAEKGVEALPEDGCIIHLHHCQPRGQQIAPTHYDLVQLQCSEDGEWLSRFPVAHDTPHARQEREAMILQQLRRADAQARARAEKQQQSPSTEQIKQWDREDQASASASGTVTSPSSSSSSQPSEPAPTHDFVSYAGDAAGSPAVSKGKAGLKHHPGAIYFTQDKDDGPAERPADAWGPDHMLTLSDKKILQSSHAWLNDNILMAFTTVLLNQAGITPFYTRDSIITGLSRDLWLRKKEGFRSGRILQFLNLGSSHWVVASVPSLEQGSNRVCDVYDSLTLTKRTERHYETELQSLLTPLLPTHLLPLNVRIHQPQVQSDSHSCGPIAAAWLYMLAAGMNPTEHRLRVKELRQWMLSLLEQPHLTNAPPSSASSTPNNVPIFEFVLSHSMGAEEEEKAAAAPASMPTMSVTASIPAAAAAPASGLSNSEEHPLFGLLPNLCNASDAVVAAYFAQPQVDLVQIDNLLRQHKLSARDQLRLFHQTVSLVHAVRQDMDGGAEAKQVLGTRVIHALQVVTLLAKHALHPLNLIDTELEKVLVHHRITIMHAFAVSSVVVDPNDLPKLKEAITAALNALQPVPETAQPLSVDGAFQHTLTAAMDLCGLQKLEQQLPLAVMGILRPFDKRSRDMESIVSLPNRQTLHGQSRGDPLESETAELRSRTPMVMPEEDEPASISQRCKRRRTQNKTPLSEPDPMLGRTRNQTSKLQDS
jgi:hypothetical protein